MDALTLEEYTCRTWPTLETLELDGWLLRFANGVTGRANAVYPLYPSKRDVSEKIGHVEQHYHQRGLRPMFKLTEPLHKTLDAMLDQRGYTFYNDSFVMMMTIGERIPTPKHEVVLEPFSDAWLSDLGQIHAERHTQTSTYHQMLTSEVGKRIYASIWVEGQRVAIGLLSWSRSYGGVYCMATHPDHRGQGMATSIVNALLTYGQANGVRHAFLQVAAHNAAAQTAYRRCGFDIAYRYWYRYIE